MEFPFHGKNTSDNGRFMKTSNIEIETEYYQLLAFLQAELNNANDLTLDVISPDLSLKKCNGSTDEFSQQ